MAPCAPRAAPFPNEERFLITAEDDSGITSELMHVQVTIYSLEGLVRHTEKEKGRTKKKILTNRASGHGKTIGTACGARSSANGPSSGVPTTAVVSVTDLSSGFALQTFMPSMELKIQAPTEVEDIVRCSAYWRDDGSAALLGFGDSEEPSSSTFELTRVMKRETFRPGTKIGLVSHYVHERLDLDVYIGKGKERIPLGVASIAISGDEEREVITNVPVRALLSEGDRREKKIHKHFMDDPNMFIFNLDANATLRVGTRVFPQRLQDQIEKRKQKFNRACYIGEPAANAMIIELTDENSLIAQLKLTEDKGVLFTSDSISDATESPEKSGFGGFFCGALPLYTGDTKTSRSFRKSKRAESLKRVIWEEWRSLVSALCALQQRRVVTSSTLGTATFQHCHAEV
jgi:hypothetical protein